MDLDGTLAEYHGWQGAEHIGAPVPAMLARVRAWLAAGYDVRIFTARVAHDPDGAVAAVIDAWCAEHLGRALPITNTKDYGMVELWDDRAVQVIPNEGVRVDMAPDAPVDQRPNGCWAACVATITGIPLDDLDQNIPDGASEEWFWEHATELHNDMVRRLRARGWRLDYIGHDVPRGFAIASGKSPRLATVLHAVVVRDGVLWHDPHPSRAGIVTVDCFEVLTPILATLEEDAPLPVEVA